MTHKLEVMKKGVLVAVTKPLPVIARIENTDDLVTLEHEKNSKWRQPLMLYVLTVMCSLGAAT